MRVLVFGDSIAFGGYDSQGGWVDRVKRVYQQKIIDGVEHHNIINLGIGGDTSTLMLARMESAIASARLSTTEIAVVFSIGVNDSRFVVSSQQNQTEIEEYEANIQKIIDTARKYTDRVLVVGLHTLHPDHPEVFTKDFMYKAPRIGVFDASLNKISTQNNVHYIPLKKLVANKKEMFHTDKLHLSDEGHKVIAEEVLPHIEETLGSMAP